VTLSVADAENDRVRVAASDPVTDSLAVRDLADVLVTASDPVTDSEPERPPVGAPAAESAADAESVGLTRIAAVSVTVAESAAAYETDSSSRRLKELPQESANHGAGLLVIELAVIEVGNAVSPEPSDPMKYGLEAVKLWLTFV